MSLLTDTLRVAQLATDAKSFGAPGPVSNVRLNALHLHTARVALAYVINRVRRRRLAAALSPSERLGFDRDGFVVREGFLPPSLFAALKSQVEQLRTTVRERHEGSTLLRKIPIEGRCSSRYPR